MEHLITIKKLITGGKGLARLESGQVIMVTGVLPGETVRARETKVTRGYVEAEVTQILTESPERINAPCPYYQACGGCNLQHATYTSQLAIKQEIVCESFLRAGITADQDLIAPTLPSPEPFAYRYRIRLHVNAQGQVGFHRRGSNEVVAITHCLLATSVINDLLTTLASNPWPTRLQSILSSLVITQDPQSSQLMVLLEPTPTARKQTIQALVASLADLKLQVQVKSSRQPTAQPEDNSPLLHQDFTTNGHRYTLQWDAACFFQVNAQQNARLVALATQAFLPVEERETALDLFCGMGNFSLPLALSGALVTGVEHNRHSVHFAQRNSTAASIATSTFHAQDVARFLAHSCRANGQYDLLFLDPPRQGLGKSAALLPQLNPRTIVYVSCDPATLVRDLRLILAAGYSLQSCTPVDMFPQTHHIESVTVLERN